MSASKPKKNLGFFLISILAIASIFIVFQNCNEGFDANRKLVKKISSGNTGGTTGGTTGTTGGTTSDSGGITGPGTSTGNTETALTSCDYMTTNYYDYISQRWRDLDMETQQVQALANGGKDAVTAIHARWLVTVVRELARSGARVGLEYYHNPVPNTDWYFSNDIILISEGGMVCSADVIVGRDNWTQGDPSWILGNPNPDDWRDAFSPEFDGIGF